MKLYEFAPTRSIRVRWTLQELDVPFEAINVNLLAGEQRSPGFLRLNPAGKVPVLVDGNLVLSECVAIALYLTDKYPDRELAPRDPILRAELNRWLLFTVTELEQPLWRISRNTMLYPEPDRLPRDVAKAGQEFTQMAAIVEDHMQDRRFLVGDRVSVADFVLAHTLDWGNEVGLLGDCPTLLAYMESLYARPKAPPRISEALRSVGLRQ